MPRPAASSPDVRPLPRFRRALATTDFSELGNRAVRYAYGLVGPGGAVHLLHVLDERDLPSPLYAHYERASRPTEEMREREASEATSRLESLVPAQAEIDGIETHCEVVRGGDPAAAIRAAAERLGVDVICLATHGRSGLSDAITGSVARRVLTRNPRPSSSWGLRRERLSGAAAQGRGGSPRAARRRATSFRVSSTPSTAPPAATSASRVAAVGGTVWKSRCAGAQ